MCNFIVSPEKRLLSAVLERAILDALGAKVHIYESKKIIDALEWITDWDENDEPKEDDFSFPWVCLQLDLEPKEIRNLVEGFIARQMQSKAIQPQRKTGSMLIYERFFDDRTTVTDEELYFQFDLERPQEIKKRA